MYVCISCAFICPTCTHLKASLVSQSRAIAETDYAKALSKCHSQQGGYSVNCSVASCWKDIQGSGMSLSQQHNQFGTMCSQVSQKLGKTIDNTKNVKTKLMANQKKLLATKSQKRAVWSKTKAAYYDAVKQAETAVLNRDAGKGQNLDKKQMAKLEKAVQVGSASVESTHQAYQKAVHELRKIEQQHETERANMLAEFQQLEMERLLALRKQLERFRQAHEFLKNSLDQIIVMVNAGEKAVDLDKDIQDFIGEHTTGLQPTEHTQ